MSLKDDSVDIDETFIGTVDSSKDPAPAGSSATRELPALVTKAQLVALAGPEAGQRFPITDVTTIGRASDATIRLQASDVSRRHCTIRPASDDSGLIVEDQGSRNGLFVDGVPLQRGAAVPLELGGRLQVGGQTVLVLTPYDDVEERLRRSQRLEAIGQLAGGIAHDFNNLLATLLAGIGYLETLDDGDARFSDHEVRECLQDMDAAGRMAAQLTQRLLNFARGGRRGREAVDLSELVTEVINLSQRTFGSHIAVRADVRSAPRVGGDRAQLHQVLMNLCVNARDAMPDGGVLTVQVDERELTARELSDQPSLAAGVHAVLQVADTGCGMSKETQAHAFDPFFTTKEAGKGTGLGLSTTYGIIQDHAGSIQIQSELGAGTRFTVYLPTFSGLQNKIAGTKLSHRRVSDQIRLLLVDDDSTYVRTLRRALARLGYRVHWASGAGAVAAYRGEPAGYDLVILDSSPPRDQIAGRLQEVDPNARILLCAASSSASDTDVLAEGGLEFIQKPFTIKDLSIAIGRALELDGSFVGIG